MHFILQFPISLCQVSFRVYTIVLLYKSTKDSHVLCACPITVIHSQELIFTLQLRAPVVSEASQRWAVIAHRSSLQHALD